MLYTFVASIHSRSVLKILKSNLYITHDKLILMKITIPDAYKWVYNIQYK